MSMAVSEVKDIFKMSHRQLAEYREIKLMEFKELFLTTDMPVDEIYTKIGVSKGDPVYRYINGNRRKHGLSAATRKFKVKETSTEERYDELEKKFQEYKELFENTDLSVNKILEKIEVPPKKSQQYQYIRERCKEEGLDGRKRHKKKLEKKSSKKKKLKKETVKPKEPSAPTVNHTAVENSKGLLDKFFHERNIKQATQKGYIASLGRWFNYVDYNDLQENIDVYIREEDNRVPTRDRTIKKEMLGFREHLINDKAIKSDKSVRSYFSKIGTIFRHFGLEIPSLPQVKMEKGYVSNYNDLPTHDMIRKACDQSPVDLKAIILFMSSSGSAKAETLSITLQMFLEGCADYLEEKPTAKNIPETIKALSDRHDLVPLIYLRRIKTDKWYYTCCSPEASYIIIEALKIRKNLKWTDKLFDYTPSLILSKFQEINDNNNWGYVGAYRRFRSHALRKFMASNIGLPRDQVDSFQGRAKDMIQEAYFKQDPQALKKIYLNNMHRVMIYDNWGHGVNLEGMERKAKRLFNDFNDDEKILDLSTVPATPEEIKTSIGIEDETVHTDRSTRNVNHNSANTMPVTAPVEVPVGTVAGSLSISEELLNYAKLMDMGLISIAEFNRIKQKLLGAMLY